MSDIACLRGGKFDSEHQQSKWLMKVDGLRLLRPRILIGNGVDGGGGGGKIG